MTSYRVIIVEDQHEVSRLLRSALETLGNDLEVVEIPSGEEAILDSSRNKVDLMVADYRLPGMSGIELMHKVRKNHPQAKIILVTGQTDPRIRKDVAEAGADAFFLKPVQMADFLDAVERHLHLVETILPPEPISTDVEEIRFGIPDLLAGLRQELAATAVLILNDSGKIEVRAGDLPDSENEIALVTPLLSIHSAGKKVSRLIGRNIASNLYFFNGVLNDLVFAPVGSTRALLVIGKGVAGGDQLIKTLDGFSKARKDIEKGYGEIAQDLAVAQEMHAPPSESTDQEKREFEPLLKDAKKKLKSIEVDEFWKKAAGEQKTPSEPDKLSYDQARQLGLAPEDES